jgi:hypothetical protein
MRRITITGRGRSIKFLVLSVVSLLCLVVLFVFVPPSSSISFFSLTLHVSVLLLFVLFVLVFSLTTFFLRNKKHGILFGSFVDLYLVFRIFGFVHPLFLFLLIALFLSLELLLSKGTHPSSGERTREQSP